LAHKKNIFLISGLPKPRSRKALRRILRKICSKEADQLGDLSSAKMPEVVEALHKQVYSAMGWEEV
jgi:acetyl-CoA synthetase